MQSSTAAYITYLRLQIIADVIHQWLVHHFSFFLSKIIGFFKFQFSFFHITFTYYLSSDANSNRIYNVHTHVRHVGSHESSNENLLFYTLHITASIVVHIHYYKAGWEVK